MLLLRVSKDRELSKVALNIHPLMQDTHDLKVSFSNPVEQNV